MPSCQVQYSQVIVYLLCFHERKKERKKEKEVISAVRSLKVSCRAYQPRMGIEYYVMSTTSLSASTFLKILPHP